MNPIALYMLMDPLLPLRLWQSWLQWGIWLPGLPLDDTEQ